MSEKERPRDVAAHRPLPVFSRKESSGRPALIGIGFFLAGSGVLTLALACARWGGAPGLAPAALLALFGAVACWRHRANRSVQLAVALGLSVLTAESVLVAREPDLVWWVLSGRVLLNPDVREALRRRERRLGHREGSPDATGRAATTSKRS